MGWSLKKERKKKQRAWHVQGMGRAWAGHGQGMGRAWAGHGQGMSRVWAGHRQGSGRVNVNEWGGVATNFNKKKN